MLCGREGTHGEGPGLGRNGKGQRSWEEKVRLTRPAGQEPAGCSSTVPGGRYDKTFGSISQLGNTEGKKKNKSKAQLNGFHIV